MKYVLFPFPPLFPFPSHSNYKPYCYYRSHEIFHSHAHPYYGTGVGSGMSAVCTVQVVVNLCGRHVIIIRVFLLPAEAMAVLFSAVFFSL